MSQRKTYDTIIIGSGLAGIACAIRLRNLGLSVLVIEKNDTYGGKLNEIQWEGYRWDKGPSLFTEPEHIEELFELCGKNPKDFFQYKRMDSSCSYHFANGKSAKMWEDCQQNLESLDSIAGPEDLEALKNYTAKSAELFSSVGEFFLSNSKPSVIDAFSPALLKRYPTFTKRQIRSTLNNHNTRSFDSSELVQIMNRFGTYNGSNPYQMSGLYSMISHLELSKGTFAPIRGMRSIVDALYKLSVEIGVEYAFSENVEADSTEKGYSLIGTSDYTCNSLVCAIDHVTFYEQILKDAKLAKKYKRQERSSSGLVFYWAIEKEIPELDLHNIFFSNDYEKEAETLWKEKSLSYDPTIYINVSSTVTPSDAPKGGQNWFIMVNTPANTQTDESYRKQVKLTIIDRIRKAFKVDITDSIVNESYWDCAGIENDTGSYHGAIYGASSNKMTSALLRHGNKSSKYSKLFFCGGTVHPGGGIPLVMRSAKIVEGFFK